MDNNHFVLATRYRANIYSGKSLELDLKPEEKYYFYEQEDKYLILALRKALEKANLTIDNVANIEKYYIPVVTEDEVKIVIGV